MLKITQYHEWYGWKLIDLIQNKNGRICGIKYTQSSWWIPVLRPKTSKTSDQQMFQFLLKYIYKINCRIWFGPVNSNFLFKDCNTKKLLFYFQALASDIIVNKDCLFEIPEEWSLSEAATVYSAFGLVYYALKMKGRISKESSILITNASSSIGQAAISVALFMGCQIFAVVSTRECRQYIKFRHPTLQNIYVIDNTEQFEGDIFRKTKGKGMEFYNS